jgi:hypothetical protein
MKATRRIALALTLAAFAAQAQESRTLNPIARPPAGGAAPAAAVAPRSFHPVPPELVRAAVEKLVKAWNTPDLAPLLSERFPDKARLLDTLASQVPRDARLNLLAIQGIQVLEQRASPAANGIEQEVVSRVSVTFRTQVEYNDPASGFQRREGVNEAILLVRETP